MDVLTRKPRFKVSIDTLNFGLLIPSRLEPAIVAVQVNRRMGEAAGTFTLTFLPASFIAGMTAKNAISPMDYVEIQLDSGEDRKPVNHLERSEPCIVMRGFVDSVEESGTIASGIPSRTIIVTGRDWGKIAMNFTIYSYSRSNTPKPVALLESFNGTSYEVVGKQPELTGGGSDTTSLPTTDVGAQFGLIDIMFLIFNNLYQRQVDALRAAQGQPDLRTAFQKVNPPGDIEFNVDGVDGWSLDNLKTFNPSLNALNYDPNTTIWEFLKRYQNTPWQELFFDDDNDRTRLIFRTTPWLDIRGLLVGTSPLTDQPQVVLNGLSSETITSDQLISWTFGKSDADVLSLFSSLEERYGDIPLGFLDLGAFDQTVAPIDPGVVGVNPAIIGGLDGAEAPISTPSTFRRFGLHQYTAKSPFFSVNSGQSENEIDQLLFTVGRELNKRLVLALGHAELLWSGEITIRGNPTVHIGDYIIIKALDWKNGMKFYVTGVSHNLRVATGTQDGHFQTTLVITRGQSPAAATP